MRITPVQTSFASGEISPRLQARFDLDAYYSGAAELKNFVCLPHGPLLRRGGTTFINQAKQNDVRLIAFKFSIEQSLVLEFGNYYVRFYFKGGPVYTSPDSDVQYEVVTPWSSTQIHDIDWAQSGDTMYIVHPNVAPQKLVRYANNNWTITPVSFINKPDNWTGTNWPSCVTFHEQRLFYAATPNKTQTVWASNTGIFDDFTMRDAETEEVLDSNAIEYTLSTDDVNGIKWLKSLDVLVCGTSGAEFRIRAGSSYEAITPSNCRIAKQTACGSKRVQPQQVGNGILFAQRGGTRVRYFEYSYTDDQYVATDLTIMSEHILNSSIKEMDLQTVRDTYVWFVLDNGDLVGCTYDKAQKVNAWHKHNFNGKVISLAIIPGDKADEVWLAIQRTINGVTRTYIEVLFDSFSERSNNLDCEFMDSHLAYHGNTEIVQVGGLDHLEGEEVAILVDGWVHPNEVVTDGSVRLQDGGKDIIIGLPFESYFKSCQIQSSESIIFGNRKRIYAVTISLLQSLGLIVQVDSGPEQQVFMGPTRIMNKAKPLFTGTLQVKIPSSSDDDQSLIVKQILPLPCEIRAIKYEVEVSQ